MRSAACVITCLSVVALGACQSDKPLAQRPVAQQVCDPNVLICDSEPPPPPPPPPPVPYSTVATGFGNGGSLQVILLGEKDSLPYLIYQTTGGTWYSRGRLPDPAGVKFSAIATGRGNGGSLQVLLLGARDSLLYLIYQTTSGTWYWAGHLAAFSSTKFTGIAAGSGNQDYLQVIGLGASDHLPYLIWQDGGGGWNWAGHLSVFGTTQLSTVTSADRGNLTDLRFYFLQASNGYPYQIWQSGADGGWHALHNTFANFSFKAPLAADTGNFPADVVVFGRGQDNLLYAFGDNLCGFYYCENPWYGQLPGGVPFSAVAVGDGNDQLLQVIGLGLSDGLPYLTWGDKYGNWFWHGALPDPNSVPFKAVATGNGNGGSLQVILLGKNDGLPYLIYQTTSGAWYWRGLLPDP